MTARSWPRVFSLHTDATAHRCNVQAFNLNSWCRVPGTPFAPGLVLLPNPPGTDRVSVIFGPIALSGELDTITCLLVSPDQPAHDNRLGVDIEVLDSAHGALARSRTRLGSGSRDSPTLTFPHGERDRVHLRIGVSFSHFAGGPAFGSVRLHYAVAYQVNPLVDLFNAAGSDKGTQAYWGEGFPHCYALDYHAVLAPFRDDAFNMLEIGLDTASQASGDPDDAPSLRVWHEFLPNAELYGYDINDFGFFQQPRTRTFQGDQSSRADLARFLETFERPRFRVVIDDGSHASSHQQISLAALFPHVEPSGVYIIEDLNWQPYAESPTTLEMLSGFNERGVIESPVIEPEEALELEASIEAVEIHKPNDSELAVIRKKPA